MLTALRQHHTTSVPASLLVVVKLYRFRGKRAKETEQETHCEDKNSGEDLITQS